VVTLAPPPATKSTNSYRLIPDKLPDTDIDARLHDDRVFRHVRVTAKQLSEKPWVFVSKDFASINAKIDAAGELVGRVLLIGQGMQTGRNDVFGERSLKSERSY
jgi:hypothetical protein